MISLILQMFGGGGSGSGGKGGGKTGTGATNAVAYSSPDHHGSAGGRAADSGKKRDDNGDDKRLRLGGYITSPGKIEEKSDYVLINVKDGSLKGRSGSDLLKLIDDKKIRYDRKKYMWVSNTGKYYDLRKRKR